MADATQDPSPSQNNEVSSTEPEIRCNGEIIPDEPEPEPEKEEAPSIPVNNFRLRSSLLSPSTSNVSGTPNRTFVLNPPRLSNPFTKPEKEKEVRKEENEDSEKAKEEVKPVSFVPLEGDHQTPSSSHTYSQPVAPSLGFVFGQNIHEKVEAAAPQADSTNTNNDSENKDKKKDEDGDVTTNGTTSEMLFSSSVKKEAEKALDGAGKTLSEAAREYEEARAVKRKFEEVQVVTGEEEESNVLQINCKLFSWSSYNWVEKGRGTLRVNDFPATNPPQHRVIMRISGSHRLVLNTKLWPDMTVDKASSKSMRLTAMDNGIVKVFLVMASPKEIDQLYKCLEWRVNNLRKLDFSFKKKIKDDDSD